MNELEQIKAMLAEDPELLAQMMGGDMGAQDLGPPLPAGAGVGADELGMAAGLPPDACPPGEVPVGGGEMPVDPMEQEALMRALMGPGGPPQGPPMR